MFSFIGIIYIGKNW